MTESISDVLLSVAQAVGVVLEKGLREDSGPDPTRFVRGKDSDVDLCVIVVAHAYGKEGGELPDFLSFLGTLSLQTDELGITTLY